MDPGPQLSRNAIKWLQSLDLSHSVKNIRRDLANGCIVAQIFSRYYAELQLHSFDNGPSMATKKDNWEQLQKFFLKQGLKIPANLVEATEKGIQGAAQQLVEHLYELFTGKRIQPRVNASEVYPRPELKRPATKRTAALAPDARNPLRLPAGSKKIGATLSAAPNVKMNCVCSVEVSQVPIHDIMSLRKHVHDANQL
eukprot:CAMPEP_0198206094 /NCGR_PEP_ID=MMETSP1445-20131203/9616_1 /TAXON_ID=36898 /ORGANISM="Pyramimonas sp., Strain CCMP2087" /LENGTH=196 /DNA_ID=CAMNT_0043878641 /DNA_START=268 /DNA_END=858 /DNA_ORIENTATION=-